MPEYVDTEEVTEKLPYDSLTPADRDILHLHSCTDAPIGLNETVYRLDRNSGSVRRNLNRLAEQGVLTGFNLRYFRLPDSLRDGSPDYDPELDREKVTEDFSGKPSRSHLSIVNTLLENNGQTYEELEANTSYKANTLRRKAPELNHCAIILRDTENDGERGRPQTIWHLPEKYDANKAKFTGLDPVEDQGQRPTSY